MDTTLQHDKATIAVVISGGFGDVRFETRFGMRVAIKTARVEGETMEHEAAILSCLNHPFIPMLLAYSPSELVMADVGRNSLTEMLNDSLLERIHYDKTAWCVASALAYMHGHSVHHTDVKCDNVVVGSSGDAVLVDYNLADHTSTGTSLRRCGSPSYCPPEVYANHAPWDVFAADAWSYSVLYFAILYKRLPFDIKDGTVFQEYTRFQFQHGSTRALMHIFAKSSSMLHRSDVTKMNVALMDSVMQPDPGRRPSMVKVERLAYYISHGMNEVPPEMMM